MNDLKSRLGSIPDSYLRTLRPSVQKLLRHDLPDLMLRTEALERLIKECGALLDGERWRRSELSVHPAQREEPPPDDEGPT